MEKPLFPQALATSLFSRVRNENTALFITTQTSRGTKRTAHVVNYSEDYYFDDEHKNYKVPIDKDDDDFATGTRGYSPKMDPRNTTGNAVLNNFQGKLAVKTAHQYPSDYQLANAATRDLALIPIRLNLEYQNSRIVDFFLWNLYETLVTPEQFSQIMCQDLDFPPNIQHQITQSILSQIEEYSQLVGIQLPQDLVIHVVIDLSVNLDKQLYEDKFEWNLTDDTLIPEEFAENVVAELGLSREFYPAIAHALYEAIIRLKKDAIEGKLPLEIVNGAAYGREAGYRFDPENLGQRWCPTVENLSQWEIEKREIERERNIRRLKRESMRIEGDSRGAARRRGARRFDELEGTWVSI